jgi:tol-pal system protein YbgF
MRSRLGFRFGWLTAALLVTAPLAVAPTAPAFAQSQDVRSLSDRLERLQRDVDVLQRQLARGGAPSSGASSAPASGGPMSSDYINRSEDRFSALEGELRTITGKLEELSHQISQTQQRLDKLVSDVDFRLTALEKGAGGAAAAAPGSAEAAPVAPAAPVLGSPQVAPGQQRLVLQPGPGAQAGAQASAPVQLPPGSPEVQYEFAYSTLLQAQREQADFGRAEQALRAFITANPNHRLTGNAQYWLGETFYVRRDYQTAAATFAEGVAKFARSDKAPDNMLKLGMSLGQLNRKAEACGTLVELDKRYPQAPAPVKQAAQRERQRLACG